MEPNKSLSVVQAADKLIPPVEVLKSYKEQADYMVQAKMLPPGYKSGADVLTVGLRGREMGVPFWQSIQGMFPMKGRIGYMGGFLLARVAAHYPDSEIIVETETEELCMIRAKKDKSKEDEVIVSFDFKTAHDCKYDQYWDDDAKCYKEKLPWKDKRNMLYWRCVTRLINRYFPEVFGSPVYTSDEIQDTGAIEEETTETGAKPGAEGPPYETGKAQPVEAELVTEKEPPTQKTKEEIAADNEVILKKFEEKVAGFNTEKEVQEVFDRFKEEHSKSAYLLTKGFEIKRLRNRAIKGVPA